LFAPCFQADFVARLTGVRRLERERPKMNLRLVQAARDARQQYRLLRQLIAAGNEDNILDLISSM